MTRKKLLSFRARVVKDINEQLVLNLIQENEIISSTDLVKITGMRPSTIFNILKVLSERSLVSFHGKGDSTEKGGKKPYLWRLNKEAAYIIGLDIEVGEIASVILDFSGKIIAKKIIKLETGKTLDEFAGTIIKVVNEIITENNIVKEKILGLGVAVAGVVDNQNGIVIMTSVLPEMNFPLLQKLSSLPFPVLIENNANAAAIGLKWNGYNETRRNFLIILVEIDRNVSGLGIGIITGVVSEVEDILIESVRKAIEMRVLSITSNTLNIVADKYHHYSVAVGAASLILEDYFRLPVK